MATLIKTIWTLENVTAATMALIHADLDRTCCLCEATYDARTMAEELRHNEYCPKCMEDEFGADWADLTATEEQKYGKEGKDSHDSTGWKKDPHHKCLLCEKTYNSDDIAEHLRERELCSGCMGKGKGSGTHQQADDDGSTCCSDDEPDNRDDDTEDEDDPFRCDHCGYIGDSVVFHENGLAALCPMCSNLDGKPHCPRTSKCGHCVAEWKERDEEGAE